MGKTIARLIDQSREWRRVKLFTIYDLLFTGAEQLEAERRIIIADRARVQSELDSAIRNLSLDRKL